MRAIFAVLFLLVAIPSPADPQQPVTRRILPPSRTIQQNARFRVVGPSDDTSSRVAGVESFRLSPGERKAVLQTGTVISQVDKSRAGQGGDTAGPMRVFMLPELYYAKLEGTDAQISYRILFIDSAPMRYDTAKKVFESILSFLPREENAGSGGTVITKTLASPEQIFVTFGTSKIPISLIQLNWPPVEVTVSSPNPKDSLEVKILTINNPTGYPKSLRVEPAILLSSGRSTIQGLGIQTLPVHVGLIGVSSCNPIPVTLETSLGSLDSASFMLSDDTPREVILRSESIGRITLRINNPNYRSNTITLNAVFPWAFLVLAIMGGIIGSLGTHLQGRKKIRFRVLAYGGIIGLIAAVAYWGLGIMLVGISIKTSGISEAMVFGLGLIAGYFGLIGLKK